MAEKERGKEGGGRWRDLRRRKEEGEGRMCGHSRKAKRKSHKMIME